MKGILALSKKEQKRLVLLNEVEKGKMVIREAAEMLGWRVLAAYREEGAAGLVDGNWGSEFS